MMETQLSHLLENYVATGKIALRIGLLNIKKYPESGAQEKTFICAAQQGKGLAAHKTLFTTPAPDKKHLAAFAKTLGLNAAHFSACLSAPDTVSLVSKLEQSAMDAKVTLVPTMIINGESHVGLMDYSDLEDLLNTAITQ